MQVTLNVKCSPKQFEIANYLLNMACEQLIENSEARKRLSLTNADIKSAKAFRNALVQAIKDSAKQ